MDEVLGKIDSTKDNVDALKPLAMKMRTGILN